MHGETIKLPEIFVFVTTSIAFFISNVIIQRVFLV